MSLRVVKAGPLSLVLDRGRFGHAALGMTQGGPMDEHAFAWANRLLDNPPDAAQIEITLGPCQLEALNDLEIAVTGADMYAQTETCDIASWTTGQIKAGQTLSLRPPATGLRTYLAVKGGFQLKPTFGSCATVSREHIGGLHGDGSALKNGDVLKCEASQAQTPRQVPWEFRTGQVSQNKLRFIPGFDFSKLASAQREMLLSSEFEISADSDRMGYRLQGPIIELSSPHSISEGLTRGTIQLPPNGQAIILMADHQTIGGYPKLGCICASDINLLAQLRPGQKLRFELMKIEQAVAKREQFEKYFQL